MKKRDFYEIAMRLLPGLPGFVSNKAELIFKSPITHTLRGFCFEGSTWERSLFRCHWFYMVTCKPTDSISLSYGGLLIAPDGTDGWYKDQPDLITGLLGEIEREALHFLSGVDTPSQTADAIRATPNYARGLHEREEVAYLQILAGEVEMAERELDHLTALKIDMTYGREWMESLFSRVRLIREKLERNSSEAKIQLLNWERQTVEALKLEKWYRVI